MGKANKKSRGRKGHRPNPVGLPSNKDLEEMEEEGVIVSNGNGHTTDAPFVENILQELLSVTPEDRCTALNSLSTLAAQKKLTHLDAFKRSSVIKTVSPLLLDPDVSVRNACAGALRNLSAVDEDMCHSLVKEGVMVPLVVLLKERYKGWTPLPSKKQDKIHEPLEDTLIQALVLLWNLCESTPTCIQICNKEHLHSTLSTYLDWTVYGERVSTTTAQCLYTITEDNTDMQTSHLQQTLTTILKQESPTHLKTLALGTLLNLSPSEKLDDQIKHSIFSTILSASLSQNHLEIISKFSSDIPVDEDMDIQKLTQLNQTTEDILSIINSSKSALEILSNLLCGNDDDSTIDDEDDEDAMDCDDDTEMVIPSPNLPMDLFTSLTHSLPTLLPQIIQKIKCLPANVQEILKSNPISQIITTTLTSLRTTALICLQNLYQALPLEIIDSCGSSSTSILEGLSILLKDPTNDQLTEATTSAIRSILQQHVTEDKKTQIPPKIFTELFSQKIDKKIKINLIKIIGLIAILHRGSPDEMVLLKEVGLFLFKHLPPKVDRTNLYLTAEVLDTLIDVFSEDESDGVLVMMEAGGRLSLLSAEVKKVGRAERRNMGEEVRAVVQTVVDNLPRFLEYKGKRGVV